MGEETLKTFYKNLNVILKNNGGTDYSKYSVKDDTYRVVRIEDSEQLNILNKLGQGLLKALGTDNTVPKVKEEKSGNKVRYFFEVANGNDYALVDILTSHLKKTGTRIDTIQVHYDLKHDEVERIYGKQTSTGIDTIQYFKDKAVINPKSALLKKNKYYKTGLLK